MDNCTNVLIFNGAYPLETQMEGLAVHWAVISGACNHCKHLSICEKDETFVQPADAACMVKKAKLLKEV